MNEQRLKGLMGLSVRAGQAVFGEDGCLKAIRGGKCALLLLDEAASPATRDKYESACRRMDIPLVSLRENLLLEATGRPGKAMAALKGGLAEQMISVISGQ